MSVSIDYTGGVFQANRAKKVGTVTAGTETYDIANASYDSKSFSVSTQGTFPFGISLSSDGTKMYVANNSSNVPVNQYSLSTAFDISTASYSSSYSTGIAQGVRSLYIKPDGSKFYVLIADSNDSVYQYSMSTYWDITSSSSDSTSFSVNTQESNAHGLTFKPDGTKMYITGQNSNSINEYNLSTAWDVSTASYSQQFTINTQSAISDGVAFNSTGTKFFILDSNTDKVFQYSMTTAWDVSTASYDSINFSVASQDSIPTDFYFKPDGTKMYVVGNGNDTVYQYSTGTATTLDLSTGNYFSHTPSVNTVFAFSNPPASGTAAGFALALTGGNAAEVYDIANASYDSVSFSVQTQDSAPQDLTFKSDGTKMYVIGAANDNIYQYSLSTAWDLSTASYDSVSFSVASQEISPSDVFFKPDGSKFYICGFANDTVFQYSMSTAWDISTASYDSISFSVATQEDNPRGIVFKPDGTKLFVIGNGSDAVQEYSLSTAWDLSTASHSSSFSVSSQETAPQGLFFHPDGDKFWITGNSDKVWQYSLSTAWDVSTASYSSLNFSTTGQMGIPVGVEFKSDGTKMYLIDNQSSQYIYQYTTGSISTATFTYPSSVKFPSGIAPTGPAIDETDVLVFYTDDGGTTYQGFKAGDAMA